MVTYDGELVREYADRLHRSAAQTILMYVLGGLMTGASFGMVSQDARTTALAAILVGIIGYIMGRGRAFRLELEAQLALCQVEIEKNTRERAARAERDG